MRTRRSSTPPAAQRIKKMSWIFGPSFRGHPKTVEMKELKKFDVFQRAIAFKARVDAFFIKQVDVFQKPKPWAPFPLATMTCIGIEMLGSYKYGDALGDRNDHFKKLAENMHPRFSNLMTAPDGISRKQSYFLYKGFRNSLAHGFYGKWVFITHDEKKAKTFRYNSTKKLIVLNVYWFYKRFKEVYDDYFRVLLSAKDASKDPLKTFNTTFERNFSLWV